MPPKPRVVFDTNIYISAIIFGGSPRICLEAARGGDIELFTSKSILFELSSKLRDKFDWSGEDIKEVVVGISKFAQIVAPKEKVSAIKPDPSDNKILEACLEAKADFLISGDKKHVLPIGKFRGTKIISAAEFLKQL